MSTVAEKNQATYGIMGPRFQVGLQWLHFGDLDPLGPLSTLTAVIGKTVCGFLVSLGRHGGFSP